MEYVMGIDGGGTKTHVIVADRRGNIVAEATAGATNPNTVAAKELEREFQGLFLTLKKQNSAALKDTAAVFAGMSGAGSIGNKTKLHKLLQELLPGDTAVQVEMDTVNALYSGTYGSPGIVQIAGTGSITYGVNAERAEMRVGGWGYLFGDEGSGYAIGRQGLAAALKYFDGRGAETRLLELICKHFSVNHPQKLITKVYAAASPKSEISPLSKIVFQAYKEGDIVATNILLGSAQELAHNIRTVYTKLFKKNKETAVVLCGGVFNEKDIIPEMVKNELSGNQGIQLILPDIPPVMGSVIGAYQMKRININAAIINNLRG